MWKTHCFVENYVTFSTSDLFFLVCRGGIEENVRALALVVFEYTRNGDHSAVIAAVAKLGKIERNSALFRKLRHCRAEV